VLYAVAGVCAIIGAFAILPVKGCPMSTHIDEAAGPWWPGRVFYGQATAWL